MRLTFVTLQQGVFWEPIWEPTKNPTFWYHERMLLSSTTLETDLSQTQKCLEEPRHL
jgi:hypothetical protein